jgi:hypothetical protein
MCLGRGLFRFGNLAQFGNRQRRRATLFLSIRECRTARVRRDSEW